ncbi:DUF4226 domain-containing protein [Mycolicibacterium confluentis]|uniref:Uncharacterized protein n=1 Tax=Mycolicibacterium confluentis TaxID=28047 RepID=A0A7I7Y4Q1_9MYCO|nr:DUF4226 domain-containing protein [Mycolicibacterium confluentis]MCV7318999.1 DUF4226 domain-containing protein [Mycolicibacterium confluentis]ORV28832.1 hypothetical protein AWB99_17150 [Mycolicibacterium confluentis]BBZ36609.1 hypothetical protein MCNF_52140 [Mycolicibacterium confluentis]
MTEQAGDAAAVLDARQSAVLARRNNLATADRVLAAVVADAHTATLAARRRLDDIEDEVEALVTHQDELGLDTAAGVLAVQRFLVEKLREIHSVVADAASDAAAKTAVLQGLSAQYGTRQSE